MGKGTCMYIDLKSSLHNFKNLDKNVFKNSFLGSKFSNKLFLAIFGQKFDKSSEPAELDRRKDACNSAK